MAMAAQRPDEGGPMRRALFLLPLLLLLSCATVAPQAPSAARAELVPTGTLRVGLIGVSPAHVTQNTPPGVTRGIAVDIAQEMARRLGASMQPVRYPSVRALMDAASKDEWDVAFAGINPERADLVNFTAPYMYVEEAPIGMAVHKRRPAGFAYAFEFIEQMKASGAIQEAIAREGLPGVRAAR
jgi:ABC-type amino acid transport substrate-binding protein